MQSGLIDSIAEAIALAGNGGTWDVWYNEEQKEFHRKRARAALETIAEYYEGYMDKVGYGNAACSEDQMKKIKAVASEMRRILHDDRS